MKNLHLMPMSSVFDDDLIIELNSHFPQEDNIFIVKSLRERIKIYNNCIADKDAFTAQYINDNEEKYQNIFLHSLFLNNEQLFRLSPKARRKIVWIVWGHDLYENKKRIHSSQIISESIHSIKKILRGTYIKEFHERKHRAIVIADFKAIGIGYKYDEKMIRKKYGKDIKVVYGPYFSKTTEENVNRLRKMHSTKSNSEPVNILLGHSGFEFLEHEKYLKLLSKYKNENMNIHLILSYGASTERINKLRKLAYSLFGKEKCTIMEKMMPKVQYYEYLTKMDIAIFPFKHQSALGNTKRLAYMGVKLYLHPRGVLFKGFKDSGVKVYNCLDIGRVSFEKFCQNDISVDINAPLFETFNYQKNIEAWRQLLQS